MSTPDLVTITLTRSRAFAVREALVILASIDGGENTDYDELMGIADEIDRQTEDQA